MRSENKAILAYNYNEKIILLAKRFFSAFSADLSDI
jgi:hypothetical protein